MNRLTPELPSNFSERQLEALRALLILCRGHVSRWGKLFPDDSPATLKDIARFIGEGGRLDYEQHDGRPKLQAVYKAVYEFLRADSYGIRSAIQPIFQRVYGNDISVGWEMVYHDVYSASPQAYPILAERLCGDYITYRRGTLLDNDGEIVISPMRIYYQSFFDRTNILFEISYPLRSINGLGKISGQVFLTKNHLHFLGYDVSSSSPYLLCVVYVPGDDSISEFNGMALRTTTQSIAFSARVFGMRFGGGWDRAQLEARIYSESEFRLSNEKLLSIISNYIDNNIDNSSNFVLRQYGKHERQRS